MKAIKTDNAPQAIGPYSQAIQAGDFIYVSGQLPINPATGEMADSITENTKQAMKNIQAILQEAGADLDKVVKTQIFLTDLNDFNETNEAYATFFGDTAPARSTVQVAALPKGAPLEIEAIAYIG